MLVAATTTGLCCPFNQPHRPATWPLSTVSSRPDTNRLQLEAVMRTATPNTWHTTRISLKPWLIALRLAACHWWRSPASRPLATIDKGRAQTSFFIQFVNRLHPLQGKPTTCARLHPSCWHQSWTAGTARTQNLQKRHLLHPLVYAPRQPQSVIRHNHNCHLAVLSRGI